MTTLSKLVPECQTILDSDAARDETVVLWKVSDANLKLACLTVHFLPI